MQSLPTIRHLSTREGLSHRWVFDIMRDSRGFMWISTHGGLNRYNGHTFKTFQPSAAGLPLGADRVRWAEERADGSFLLSTEIGLLRFDPFAETFEQLSDRFSSRDLVLFSSRRTRRERWRQESYPQNYDVTRISLFREDQGELTLIKTLDKPRALDMQLVRQFDNSLWFWTPDGVYHRLDLQSWQWREFPIDDLINAAAPIDRQGRCWYADTASLRFFQLPADVPPTDWSSTKYNGHNLWLLKSGARQSIYRFDLRTLRLEKWIEADGLDIDDDGRTFEANSLFVDPEGMLWLGHFQGFLKVQRGRKLFDKYLDQPFPPGHVPPVGFSARTMAEDEAGHIFVHENYGRFFKFDPRSGKTEQILLRPVLADSREPLPGKLNISQFAVDRQGIFWLAPSGLGLLRYDPAMGESLCYPMPGPHPHPNCVILDNDGRIWVENNFQLYLFQPSDGSFQLLPNVRTDIRYGATDPDSLWFWQFFDKGLVKIDLQTARAREIPLYAEAREHRCMLWHRGYLWLGTSRGLVKVDPATYANRTYSRAQGLPGDFVYSMLADGDHLWLGTSDGLCRFNVATEEVKNFYLEDGLSHYEFNTGSALKASDGRLYMGTLNGINAFDPENLTISRTVQPRILWSDFRYFDAAKDSLLALNFGRLAEQQSLVLPPTVENFTFYLAINSYGQPDQNRYAWRMEGLDSDWNYVGSQHYAVYNQLPPGRYTFRAKAADPFGNWTANELAIAIRVLPPWYKRWWAWLIYALAAVGVVYAAFRFQLSRRLAQVENRRLRDLDHFKSRFFANITHEFRTPLTVILGVTDELRDHPTLTEESPSTDSPDGRKAMRDKLGMIQRSGENLLRLINQILDLAKLESNNLRMNYVQGDLVAYLRYIAESLHSLARAKDVDLRVESEAPSLQMDYEPERLLYVLHNLLANAIKFTPAGGRVSLTLTVDGERTTTNGDTSSVHRLPSTVGRPPFAVITVSDTGVGIDPAELPLVFDRFYQAKNQPGVQTGGTGIGLALTRELVQVMEGEISVESTLGQGTSFRLRLPIRREAAPADVGLPAAAALGSFLPPEPIGPADQLEDQPVDDERPSLLVVEDNADVLAYLTSCLEETYALHYAQNGQVGVAKAVELIPDLIISDVMMPEMDGFDLCDILKKDVRTSHIPIILLTAKTDADSRLQGLRRGADAYLAKPFRKRELLLRLANMLHLLERLREHYRAGIPPDEAGPSTEPTALVPAKLDNVFLRKVYSLFEQHLSTELSIEELADALAMSRSQAFRKIKALTGRSPSQLLRTYRLQKARALLQTSGLNVSEVAYEVGFSSPKYFSDAFLKEFGYRPSEEG